MSHRRAANKIVFYNEEDSLDKGVVPSSSRNSGFKRARTHGHGYVHYQEKAESSSSFTFKGKGRKRTATDGLNGSHTKAPRKDGMSTKKDLSRFFDLPVELKWRIFEFCDPSKLLLLFHTPKLRDILLRAPDSVWRAARENIGMPELEAKDISERQYITLVFNKDCHSPNCNMKNVQRVNFMNCARLCGECLFATKFENPAQYKKYLRTFHPKAFDCAKDSTSDTGNRKPRGIQKLSDKLYTLRGKELEDFVKQRRILKEQIARDAGRIRTWLNEQEARRYETAQEKKQSRKAAIRDKLLSPEMGWHEDVLDSVFWAGWREYDKAAELTPSNWKKIKSPLLNTLRRQLIEIRDRGRKDALHVHYKDMMQTDPKPDLFPSFATFLKFPCIDPLWNKSRYNDETPGAVEREAYVGLEETEWNTAQASLQDSITTYQAQMETLARTRLVKAYTDHGLVVPIDPIQDSRSMFRYKPPSTFNIDYPDEEDTVLPFPLIHRVMRDRRNECSLGVVNAVAAEFGEVPEMRGRFGVRADSLMVDLGATPRGGGLQL